MSVAAELLDLESFRMRVWARGRQPDLIHRRRLIWRVARPFAPGELVRFWFTERGPCDVQGSFDVRALPGFSWVLPAKQAGWLLSDAIQAHHAAVICAAIDAGIDLLATGEISCDKSGRYDAREYPETGGLAGATLDLAAGRSRKPRGQPAWVGDDGDDHPPAAA